MIGGLLDAVTLRISLYACAALLLLSIGLGITLKVVKLQRDVARSAKAGLSAKIELQNDAIEQWTQKAEAQQLRAAAAEANAVKVRNESRQRIDRIMAAQVPSTCAEAVEWGALQGGDLAKEWEKKQ